MMASAPPVSKDVSARSQRFRSSDHSSSPSPDAIPTEGAPTVEPVVNAGDELGFLASDAAEEIVYRLDHAHDSGVAERSTAASPRASASGSKTRSASRAPRRRRSSVPDASNSDRDADCDGGDDGDRGSRPLVQEAEDSHLLWRRALPWYRRPSYYWLMPLALIATITVGMTAGPRLEIYNAIVCEAVGASGGEDIVGGIIRGPKPSPELPIVPRPSVTMVAAQLIPTGQAVWRPVDFRSSHLFSPFSPLLVGSNVHVDQPTATVKADSGAYMSPHTFPLRPRDPSKDCRQNPMVQSAVARLTLSMTLTMGLLSCFTVGWWGGLSDRWGRTRVIRIVVVGLIISDAAFFAVALFRDRLPGGYHFLLCGAAIEGLLGGYATLLAAHQAYISEVTASGSRARIFSLFMGLAFLGLAVGPVLGGYVVTWSENLLTPFWASTSVHCLYCLFAWFILPESSSPERLAAAQAEHEKAKKERAQRECDRWSPAVEPVPVPSDAEARPTLEGSSREGDAEEPLLGKAPAASLDLTLQRTGRWKAVGKSILMRSRTLFTFLQPVQLLLPTRTTASGSIHSSDDSSSASLSSHGHSYPHASGGRSHISVSAFAPDAYTDHVAIASGGEVPTVGMKKSKGLDWNLSLLSLAYFAELMCMGVMSYKVQYAQMFFDWDAQSLGYFISFIGSARGVSLVIILPLAIKVLHRPKPPLALPVEESLEEEDVASETNGLLKPDRIATNAGGSDYGTLSSAAGPSSAAAKAEGEDEATRYEAAWALRAKHVRLLHDSSFDLNLARVSVLINAASYIALALARDSKQFILASAVASLGSGAGAAISSLALNLLGNPAHAGKLFASFAIVQTAATSILGPVVFGSIFAVTTDTFPTTIFLVSASLYVLSCFLMCFVRIRKEHTLSALPPRPPPQRHGRDHVTTSSWRRSAVSLKDVSVSGVGTAAKRGRKERDRRTAREVFADDRRDLRRSSVLNAS